MRGSQKLHLALDLGARNHQESEHGLGRQQDSHFGLLAALVVETPKARSWYGNLMEY
jgi:hypothetical protein